MEGKIDVKSTGGGYLDLSSISSTDSQQGLTARRTMLAQTLSASTDWMLRTEKKMSFGTNM